ncbi:MAG: hypothetical protein EHM36_16480 [Deltaproteobacteria bacterium]|nr:MAG: hypothetical protein EHM36_16480 [Deltaproteobacteria bacterium]
MNKKPLYARLRTIRACLHECEAIMNDFLQGKRSCRHMAFSAEDDSDPVKVRKGISRAIVDIDRLSDEVEHE